jgi:hypothetical protein
MKSFLNRTLFLYLIVPLAALAILAFLVAYKRGEQGLFINLATDFISIIITVFYVDWILHKFESEKWERVEKFISDEASLIASGLIGDFADSTSLHHNIYPQGSIELAEKGLLKETLDAISGNVRSLSRRDIIQALKGLNASEWKFFVESLEKRRGQSATLISQFGTRMKPEQLEAILRLRRAISAVISSYSLFKSLLGVPPERMPRLKSGKPEEYSAIQVIRSAIELQDLLENCLRVTEVFHFLPEVYEIDFVEEIKKSWPDYL